MTQQGIAQEAPTVYVVDDDPAVLKAVAWLLQSAGYEVVTFDKPLAFIEAARIGGAGCAVLDLRMPSMSGLDVQRALREVGSTLPVVFITGDGDVPASVQAMKRGAVDFLQKPVDDRDLLAAVRRAIARDAEARSERAVQQAITERIAALTSREREVLERVAKGLLNKQIAADLGLSEVTVKVHRAKGMERLGVASAAELGSLLSRVVWDRD